MVALPNGSSSGLRNLDRSSESPSISESPRSSIDGKARWVTELAEYHFSLHHKPGMVNKKADLLSQRADHEQGKEDNDEVTVLKPEHFQALVMPTTEEVHTKIKQAMLDHHRWDKNCLCVSQP